MQHVAKKTFYPDYEIVCLVSTINRVMWLSGVAERMVSFSFIRCTHFPKFELVLSMSTRMSELNLLNLPVDILSEFLSHLNYLYILRSSTVRIPLRVRFHQREFIFCIIRFASNSMRSSHCPSSSNITSNLQRTSSSTGLQADPHQPQPRA